MDRNDSLDALLAWIAALVILRIRYKVKYPRIRLALSDVLLTFAVGDCHVCDPGRAAVLRVL